MWWTRCAISSPSGSMSGSAGRSGRRISSASKNRRLTGRFSVFHVTECGEEKYFQVEAPLEFLQTASKLRAYIPKGPGKHRR